MKKVFIDGSVGTTGLRIHERLSGRNDIEIITLTEELRKDDAARKAAINNADVVFLCLPDDAARQAVSMVENKNTVIIDTSTAHRTNEDFAYGFPELGADFEDKILHSKRIAVPGCHASGFIALVFPLVKAGIINPKQMLSCYSLTGYSGGGKKMIAEYQAADRSALLNFPRTYALTQQHKHLKEMQAITKIDAAPVFVPIVGDFYSGMHVSIPLTVDMLCGKTAEDIRNVYKNIYTGPVVKYADSIDNGGFISAGILSNTDGMLVSVTGNNERITLNAVYDNLGKGASGAAVECLNIVLGCDKTQGLVL